MGWDGGGEGKSGGSYLYLDGRSSGGVGRFGVPAYLVWVGKRVGQRGSYLPDLVFHPPPPHGQKK